MKKVRYKDIKNKLEDFIASMQEDNYSYFKYSYSGDLYDKNNGWGLGNAVFATKIMYIANFLKDVDKGGKNNIYEFIHSFSTDNGYYYDPIITKRSLIRFVKSSEIEKTRVAETRQTFAALYLLDKKPKEPFVDIPYSKAGIDKYLSRLDWSKPWDAGSHFSHLLFFLRMNSEMFDYESSKSKNLVHYAVKWVNNLQSSEDGRWYGEDNVSLQQKINGAMKILTGLDVAKITDLSHARKLADTALSTANNQQACDNFNIVYVLYSTRKILNSYREKDIKDFMKTRLGIYKDYYYPDKGGFSFYKDKANELYYGKRVSKGKSEPDIHATALFVWGLSLMDKVLDLELDFKVPVN